MDTFAEHKAQLADIGDQIKGNRKSIDEALDTLDGLLDSPEGRPWLAIIKDLRSRYAASASRALALIAEGRQEEAVSVMDAETLPALNSLQEPIRRLLEVQQIGMPVGHAAVKQRISSALTLMAVLRGAPNAVWQSPPQGDY